jgi:hypothetical protein
LANVFLQMSHSYGFSPGCVLLWRDRWDFWVKAIWHWSQAKGFCFEWILLWIVKWLWLGNLLLHVWHLCFLIEELTLNGFGICSTFIFDEHEFFSPASFTVTTNSIHSNMVN